ncbi:MAG: lipoyl domain-containing protein [bacterium]|jgi:pyruvate/2-oxoglutarate dehydrogenase complex dihydrolipoamide acyltransferase (E2) component
MGGKRTDVALPDLGDIESAVVVAWLCLPGSLLKEGDDLVEVETEKTTFIVPAPSNGILTEVRAPAGASVRIGEILGILEAG